MTQSQLQTRLNAVLVDALKAFLTAHPDTKRETVSNALTDTIADAAHILETTQ